MSTIAYVSKVRSEPSCQSQAAEDRATRSFRDRSGVHRDYCYALGSNAEAARLSGVPVQGVRTLTFVIGAFLSGAAGILYVAYLPTSTPSLGAAYVAAAVLGGCSLRGGRGSVIGVVIGASVMQVTFNAVNLIGHSLWQISSRAA